MPPAPAAADGRPAPDEHGLAGDAGARLRIEEPVEASARRRPGSDVPAASRVSGAADLRLQHQRLRARAAVHHDLRVVVRVAARPSIVQSMRAAKSFWNAVRQRQIVAWSEV